MRVTAADGTQIYVQVQGLPEQPPVLVLPGGPCRDPAYLSDQAGLGRRNSLAIVHPRGTAATGGLSRGWWKDADDVVAVADALGLASFSVLAHSAGTRLALAVAAQHPGRVRSMALVTPSAAWLTGTAQDGPAIAARRSSPEVDAAMGSMRGRPPEDECAFQHALKLEAPAGYAQWTGREKQHSGVGAMSLVSATAWFADIPGDAVQRITGAPLPPTLVLAGKQDILSGVGPVRAYARALGAQLSLVEDSGHYPWIEQPAVFRGALNNWFAGPGRQ